MHPWEKVLPKSRLPAPYVLPASHILLVLPDPRHSPTVSTTGILSVLPAVSKLPGVAGSASDCDVDDHAEQTDHNDYNDDDVCDTGTCDALEATRKAFKRVRFAAPATTLKDSCKADEVDAKLDLTAEDSCKSDAGEFENGSNAKDSCTSDADEFDDICRLAEVDPAPSIAKMGTSARRSKLSRFKRFRQRD